MSAQAQTIVEFLLARIAEDAADAATIRDCSLHLAGEVAAEDAAARFLDPDRVLADGEAKRRIVERASDDMAVYDRVLKEINPTDAEDYTNGAIWGLELALRALAAVYADHPDYRAEWRP